MINIIVLATLQKRNEILFYRIKSRTNIYTQAKIFLYMRPHALQ